MVAHLNPVISNDCGKKGKGKPKKKGGGKKH